MSDANLPEESKPEEKNEEPRKLYRSRENRVIAGVCGGIGEYLGVDPTVIRVLWVLFSLLAGSGILAYIAAWIIIPERPVGKAKPATSEQIPGQIGLLIGIILVALGIWFFLANLGLVPAQFFIVFRIFRLAFWPVLLILLGMFIIIMAQRGGISAPHVQGKVLYRSRANRMIAGVAGGIAAYFGIDPSLIRLAFVVLVFTPLAPAAIIAYIVLAIAIPEEPK